MGASTGRSAEIVAFWREAGRSAWFTRDPAFDAQLRRRFEDDHHAAARGEYAAWAHENPETALALILLLDQIPRNLFRGSAHAFATDGLALVAAEEAVSRGFDRATLMPLRIFFYLPFEHAESWPAQRRAVALIRATGDVEFTRFAEIHANVIARFGRFPHRNAALGRATTPDEADFLAAGGFSG